MGKIWQPLSCTEAITLMNDMMIENTSTKQKLIEFHQSRRLGTDSFEKGKVTTGWWRGFLRQHHSIIREMITGLWLVVASCLTGRPAVRCRRRRAGVQAGPRPVVGLKCLHHCRSSSSILLCWTKHQCDCVHVKNLKLTFFLCDRHTTFYVYYKWAKSNKIVSVRSSIRRDS